jgi:glycerate 2-kinase
LTDCYFAAIAAVEPDRVMTDALESCSPSGQRVWIIAVGKAAPGMYRAVERWLATHGRTAAGGVCIAAGSDPQGSAPCRTGDHPVPGPGSAAAAAELGATVRAITPGSEVHVCISGGTSSLIAAPLPDVSVSELRHAFAILLQSGLTIDEQNAVRKRLTEWSGGRLARALHQTRLWQWIISDVPGDDISVIGSGPCVGDPWTTAQVASLIDHRGLSVAFAPAVRRALRTDTCKPGDARLGHVSTTIVACNRDALVAAAKAARASGYHAVLMPEPLSGAAAVMGRRVATAMVAEHGSGSVLIWGGETTVTLDHGRSRGGRCQELALSAAEQLAHDHSTGTLLAAGTDGRDGPTDAAGAVVDGATWDRIARSGIEPSDALRQHTAYDALDAAGALFRPGPTGTNVMDIAVAASASPPALQP